MTVYVADAHAHVQGLVSVDKMATVLEVCTTEEQRSVVRFCGPKESIQRIFIKKCFMFTVGNICPSVFSVKNHLGGKRFADDEEVQTEVRKWLRQQSENFYAAGFDALVKRWDKCINIDGGYVEKYMFF
jgi:hypothetical protein